MHVNIKAKRTIDKVYDMLNHLNPDKYTINFNYWIKESLDCLEHALIHLDDNTNIKKPPA